MQHRILMAIAPMFALATATHAQSTIDWYTVDGGGGVSSSAVYEVTGTIGQHDAGAEATGSMFAVAGGYWSSLLPGPSCLPDVTTTNTNPGATLYGVPDGSVNGADLSFFVEMWLGGNVPIADMTTNNTNPGDPGYGVPDDNVNGADLSFYVEGWLNGCA